MKVSELIKVGDEIRNSDGAFVSVTQVDVGRCGLLVKGTFPGGTPYEGFARYELPPTEHIRNWNGWAGRAHFVLSSGMKLGVVALPRDDPRDTIEEYDAKWEETLELMRTEVRY